MTLIDIVEWLGEAPVSMLMGAATGITFGVAAQRSRFCLRAATVEFARRAGKIWNAVPRRQR